MTNTFDPQATSWHARIERLAQQIALGGVSEQIRDDQQVQTATLEQALLDNTTAVTSQTATLADLLLQLKTNSSNVQFATLTPAPGVLTVALPDIDSNLYQSFELVGVFAHLTTDATAGDRFLDLELCRPDTPDTAGLPLESGLRILYNGFRSANIAASTSKTLLWAPNAVSDNWSRTPIPSFTLPTTGFIWRIRGAGVVGAADQLRVNFMFKVYES